MILIYQSDHQGTALWTLQEYSFSYDHVLYLKQL